MTQGSPVSGGGESGAGPILGLHHVTATVDGAQDDVDFCVGALGLRLVKRTVNFDNHSVYHFYYGDDVGRPGTIWTTFPYRGRNVATGTNGAGQVTATSFSVPVGSLDAWRERLTGRGYVVTDAAPRFGEEVVRVDDPSGLVIEVIGSGDTRAPWLQGVPPEIAVRGIHSVSLTVRDPAPTVAFFEELLGWSVAGEETGRVRLGIACGGPGRSIDLVVAPPDVIAARNGLGTVHHVAMAIVDEAAQRELRESLVARGLAVTPVMDRQYFRSIYFREPGGVLLEVATMAPGFLFDESATDLGTGLRLPPWEEQHRAEIERLLPALSAPDAG